MISAATQVFRDARDQVLSLRVDYDRSPHRPHRAWRGRGYDAAGVLGGLIHEYKRAA